MQLKLFDSPSRPDLSAGFGEAGSAPGTELPVSGLQPPTVVYVRHPRARRYILRVTGAGVVRITVPRWGSKREGKLFADSQRRWIDQQLARWASEASKPRAVEVPARELLLRAKRELSERLLQLALDHHLTVARISIRNQRWRWGSCSPAGHICLNWRLVTMPEWVRDYVLIHELMHLKRMDHSRTFWKLVAAACPDYREARTWLRDYRRADL